MNCKMAFENLVYETIIRNFLAEKTLEDSSEHSTDIDILWVKFFMGGFGDECHLGYGIVEYVDYGLDGKGFCSDGKRFCDVYEICKDGTLLLGILNVPDAVCGNYVIYLDKDGENVHKAHDIVCTEENLREAYVREFNSLRADDLTFREYLENLKSDHGYTVIYDGKEV